MKGAEELKASRTPLKRGLISCIVVLVVHSCFLLGTLESIPWYLSNLGYWMTWIFVALFVVMVFQFSEKKPKNTKLFWFTFFLWLTIPVMAAALGWYFLATVYLLGILVIGGSVIESKKNSCENQQNS